MAPLGEQAPQAVWPVRCRPDQDAARPVRCRPAQDSGSWAKTRPAPRGGVHALLQNHFVLLSQVGELLGYGWIGGPRLERPDLWLCVHPRYRMQGYGNALLERLLLRAKERGAGEVTAYIQRGSPDVIRFAAFHGLGRVGYYREFLRMVYLSLERAT